MNVIKNNKRSTIIRSQSATQTTGKLVAVGPASSPAQTNGSGHSIKLHRTGSQVDSIEVVCSCGEKMVIRCDYE
jgi:hypothetical protein